VRNYPKVIAAYLGVDDEEVEAVEQRLEDGDIDAAIAEAKVADTPDAEGRVP